MICKRCGGETAKNGTKLKSGVRVQKYKCKACKHEQYENTKEEVRTEVKLIGMSEDQFRAKFDLRFIVESKCKTLQRGIFLSMSEFVKFCGIVPSSGYRDIMLHSDFDDYRGKVRGEIYWSAPESINKLRSEGILN